jgi:two-component system response regulator AtoC
LYYRLNGFPIHLPPLRERDNDIILLAKNFLRDFCEKNGLLPKTFSREVIASFLAHPWPGNVRELKATVERSAIISETDMIFFEDVIFSNR